MGGPRCSTRRRTPLLYTTTVINQFSELQILFHIIYFFLSNWYTLRFISSQTFGVPSRFEVDYTVTTVAKPARQFSHAMQIFLRL